MDFLNTAGTYYLATMDGDQPRVRPIGFVMEWDGRLAFCTANTKNMYKQMVANPKVEICCYDGKGNTLRISGKADFVTSAEAQRKALEAMPMLNDMYSVGDGVFEIFCIDGGKAACSDMGGNVTEMKI
jgi:uncharacterized pyridoxamine 5'-phosphate oxidase family protein